MKPYIEFPIIGEFHTNTLLMLFGLLISFFIFWHFLKRELKRKSLGPLALTGLIIGTSFFAFFGARFFHVFIERPQHFLSHPELILTQFDGMTFYGALGAGTFFAWLYLRWQSWSFETQARIWDAGALSTCVVIGLMRLGCFANGCCWGKISSLPWSVQYYAPRSVMPYKGIPVHPVQVYDAALGFSIGLILWLFWRERVFRGRLFLLFLILYPFSRFMTEFFRADSFRGEDVLMGLSTSQLISVVLFVAALYFFSRRSKDRNFRY